MSLEKENSLNAVLKNIANIAGVERVAIISRGGLVIVSSDEGLESSAAMAATIRGAAETLTIESGIDLPTSVVITTISHKISITGAGSKALLIVQYSFGVNPEVVQNEIYKATPKLKTILE
ncbi:MAG: roadblock/LC7 domain-containing protein [bacterium]|nr:roadblock/LC7 domain-containing protein [bacterium]